MPSADGDHEPDFDLLLEELAGCAPSRVPTVLAQIAAQPVPSEESAVDRATRVNVVLGSRGGRLGSGLVAVGRRLHPASRLRIH